jgi:hypothetical protein
LNKRRGNYVHVNVSSHRYLGRKLTNSVNEVINSGLDSGSACYHRLQNVLPSRLLSKNVYIIGLKSLIFLYICMCVKHDPYGTGRKLTGVSENRPQRREFGPKRDEVTGS